jgi:glycosyltransferase involved in cell wall biosynthesis
MDLTGGYEHEFLTGAESIRQISFRQVNNPGVERRLEEYRPDVLVVAGYSLLTTLRVIRWANRRGVPVLMISDSELLHHRALAKRVLKQLLLRPLFRRIAGFLTTGDNNRAYFRHYGVPAEKLFPCPLTIEESAYLAARARRAELRAQTRARLQIPDDAFVVVFVGKLIPRKRPADLLAAVAAGAAGPRVCILLVGDGELRPALERQATALPAAAYRFAGFINQRELPAMYAAADALAHPAEMDPHPLSINEAVLLGLPVVVSDKVGSIGPTDTVRPNMNALVHPVGDVPALAAALRRLAENPALVRELGEGSLRVAAETGSAASTAGFVRAAQTVVARARG